MILIPPPNVGEYAPYMRAYIDLVPLDNPVLEQFAVAAQVLDTLVRSFTAEQRITPHAAGEWTIHDILGHITDAERVFGYRALRFARADTTDLAGFDENTYVQQAGANARPTEDLLVEFHAVRMASFHLLSSFTPEAITRAGTANGNPLSVRAVPYQIIGHQLHHMNSIRENYGRLLTG